MIVNTPPEREYESIFAPRPDTTEHPEALPIVFPEDISTATELETVHEVIVLSRIVASASVMLTDDKIEPVIITRLELLTTTESLTVEPVIVNGIPKDPILMPVILEFVRLRLPDMFELMKVMGRYD